MSNSKEKTINEMSVTELQAGILDALNRAQSGETPGSPAVNTKDADPVGERLMSLAADKFSGEDLRVMQARIVDVLKKGW